MSYLTTHPFRELDALRREFDRFFNAPGIRRGTSPFSRAAFLPGVAARSYPLIKLHDDGESLTVEALAPGLDPAGLKVTVVKNRLTIEGEKLETRATAAATQDAPPAGEANAPETGAAAGKGERSGVVYHRNERAAGTFTRVLTLPVEIDAEKVRAQYEDGLLRITLPRSESARPRQIKINVN